MKCLLLISTLFLSSNILFGQKVIDKTRFQCQYQFLHLNDTLTQKADNDLLILQIGQNTSKCFSYYSNQVDSIYALPNYDEIMKSKLNYAFSKQEINSNDYPHKRTKAYIYKNYPSGKMTVTDGLSLQDFIYEDKLNSQEWEIEDSIKTVLNYTCQQAKCDFRGRQWTAWFASEIPVADGPWKLCGLPGLIMEAYDENNHYHFTIIGLEQIEGTPIIFSKTYVGNKKYEKTNRKAFLKAKKRYLMDINGYIELETGIDLKGANSLHKIMQYDLIERDYN